MDTWSRSDDDCMHDWGSSLDDLMFFLNAGYVRLWLKPVGTHVPFFSVYTFSYSASTASVFGASIRLPTCHLIFNATIPIRNLLGLEL